MGAGLAPRGLICSIENCSGQSVACHDAGEFEEDDMRGPRTEKEVEDGSAPSRGLSWGISSMQGWRDNMEDAHLALPSLGESARLCGISSRRARKTWDDTSLFGVMDGHGGPQVARFCEKHLPGAIVSGPTQDIASAMSAAFFRMDELLREPSRLWELMKLSDPATGPSSFVQRLGVHPDGIGCTAVVCCVQADTLIVANAGDSRAVLCRGGLAVDLSKDHKPEDPLEIDRISRAGGWVEREDHGTTVVHRVNGDLSLSRAIGDLEYKQDRGRSAGAQVISVEPDVQVVQRQPADEFLVIACDGIWDVVSSQQAVDFVRSRLNRQSSCRQSPRNGDFRLSSVASELLDACLSPDLEKTNGLGGDNMTAIIVVFEQSHTSEVAEAIATGHGVAAVVGGGGRAAAPAQTPVAVAAAAPALPVTTGLRVAAVHAGLRHPLPSLSSTNASISRLQG
mmetsp:Transcript_23200/g.61780  ORF Transcript_23200/g.61780 Transcript_23200/m.61780 type:complete len:452 (+) Transcript_23200:83-1438(+)